MLKPYHKIPDDMSCTEWEFWDDTVLVAFFPVKGYGSTEGTRKQADRYKEEHSELEMRIKEFLGGFDE